MPASAPGGGVSIGVVAVGGSTGGRGVAPTLEAFQPRLRGRPETAPIYDEVRKVVAVPAVVGCIQSRTRCSCVTEQGSDAGYSVEECRAWLASPPFSPFRHVLPPAPAPRDAVAPAEAPSSAR